MVLKNGLQLCDSERSTSACHPYQDGNYVGSGEINSGPDKTYR